MYVSLDKSEHYSTLTIRRPDRLNALGPTLVREILSRLREIKKDLGKPGSPRALILWAEPVARQDAPIWIAGGDLKELGKLNATSAHKFALGMHAMDKALQNLPMVTVTWIDGLAIGGGSEFALFGDLRFATSRSVFHFKQLQVGLTTGFAGTERLARIAGLGVAQEALWTAQKMDMEDLLHAKLVHESFPSVTEMAQRTEELAKSWRSMPADLILQQKKLLNLPLNNRSAELQGFKKIWKNSLHRSTLEKFS